MSRALGSGTAWLPHFLTFALPDLARSANHVQPFAQHGEAISVPRRRKAKREDFRKLCPIHIAALSSFVWAAAAAVFATSRFIALLGSVSQEMPCLVNLALKHAIS
jgi:hypothetical protein